MWRHSCGSCFIAEVCSSSLSFLRRSDLGGHINPLECLRISPLQNCTAGSRFKVDTPLPDHESSGLRAEICCRHVQDRAHGRHDNAGRSAASEKGRRRQWRADPRQQGKAQSADLTEPFSRSWLDYPHSSDLRRRQRSCCQTVGCNAAHRGGFFYGRNTNGF